MERGREKKKDREKNERKKVKKKSEKKKKGKEKSVRKKREEKKNKIRIYLDSISSLNSDWNLFCALFSKTCITSSYEVCFGSASTQMKASDEPHLNSCRS